MEKKLHFRKRLYCSVIAILSLFAVCSNSLYAANNSGQGGILIDANDSQCNAQEVKVGDKAPDFTFTKDGKSVKLSDFEYYYVILNFTSSLSANSRVNSDMAILTEKYKNADAVFITISIDEYGDVAKQYGISSAPAICIIKPDGTIDTVETGNVDLAKTLKLVFGI